MTDATLLDERTLHCGGARFIAGIDEVGRGALAGPVCVGVVVADMANAVEIPGVRDSKALSPRRREALVPVLHAWSHRWAVGSASAEEIDEYGIIAALGLAAQRALREVGEIDAIILDGTTNWIGNRSAAPVHCRAKADTQNLTVAAASVLAKVDRDHHMRTLHTDVPMYGWSSNKGYGSAEHLAALRMHGASRWHRQSWHLPT
jgi:ribonuclease HII